MLIKRCLLGIAVLVTAQWVSAAEVRIEAVRIGHQAAATEVTDLAFEVLDFVEIRGPMHGSVSLTVAFE